MSFFDAIRHNLSENREWKGQDFEEYVNDLFDKKEFAYSERAHTHRTNKERYIESTLNPDFVFLHKRSNELFAVEYKYRDHLHEGCLNWCIPSQLERYQKFVEKRKIPLYIVIGVGNDGKIPPKELFVIPLEVAELPVLPPAVFQKYSMKPKMKLTYRNKEFMSTSNLVYDWI